MEGLYALFPCTLLLQTAEFLGAFGMEVLHIHIYALLGKCFVLKTLSPNFV